MLAKYSQRRKHKQLWRKQYLLLFAKYSQRRKQKQLLRKQYLLLLIQLL
ncbi:hypothetical protein FDUTEX481_09140 [Tolypothrix sp. PCC 7601]|nr:hypothetical protein FDUTEX481_09140 [Tolypothrix sp. PCC 7601]